MGVPDGGHLGEVENAFVVPTVRVQLMLCLTGPHNHTVVAGDGSSCGVGGVGANRIREDLGRKEGYKEKSEFASNRQQSRHFV